MESPGRLSGDRTAQYGIRLNDQTEDDPRYGGASYLLKRFLKPLEVSQALDPLIKSANQRVQRNDTDELNG